MRRSFGNEILIPLAIALVLAPLERATNWGGLSGVPWNANVAVQAVLVALAYILYLRRERTFNRPGLIFGVSMTTLVVLAINTREVPQLLWPDILPLLVATWWVPLIYELARLRKLPIVSFIMIAAVGLHSWWGIWQFGLQDSLGLSQLGETSLVAGQSGIATFTATGEKLVRGYGPYAHPNALGGAALLGLILLAATPQVLRQKYFSLPLAWLLTSGILITFSRSAGLGFILFLALSLPLSLSRARHSHLARAVVVIAITLFVFMPFWVLRSQDPADVALSDRQGGARNAVQIGSNQGWMRGLGPGNYEAALVEYAEAAGQELLPWQVASVHSTPLLFVLEWGLILASAVSILILGFWGAAGSLASLLLLSILPTVFLDHYWLTNMGTLLLLAVVYSALTSRVTMKRLWRVPQSLNYHSTDKGDQSS